MHEQARLPERAGCALAIATGRLRSMGWRDKYKDPEELRWIVFILAAITGLVAIVLSAGVF